MSVLGLGRSRTLRQRSPRAPQIPGDELSDQTGPLAVAHQLAEVPPVLIGDADGASGGVGLLCGHEPRVTRVRTRALDRALPCTYTTGTLVYVHDGLILAGRSLSTASGWSSKAVASHSSINGYEDHYWHDKTKFGSGVAKALVSYVMSSCGGEACVQLDYDRLAERLEFTPDEIRAAVVHLIVHGFARQERDFAYCEGNTLVLHTPGRLAADARHEAEERAKAEARAAKIALRGGRVNRAPIPAGVRDEVFQRDGNKCRRCGTSEDLTLDHIHPWSIGGPDTPDNLQALCRSCNSSKGDRV